MFDEEMLRQVASSDVSATNVHQSEMSSRQEKRYNAQLVCKRFEADTTCVKKKFKRENREQRQLQACRLQNDQALFVLHMQNASRLHAMASVYVASNSLQPLET